MYWTVSNNLCLTFFLYQRHLEAGRIKKAKLQKLPKKDNSKSVEIVSWTEKILKKGCVIYPFKQQFLQSVYQIHTMTYLQEHTCYLSTRKGLIFRWCKSTRNTRLGYKVCVKKIKRKKTPSTECSNLKVSHQTVKQSYIA